MKRNPKSPTRARGAHAITAAETRAPRPKRRSVSAPSLPRRCCSTSALPRSSVSSPTAASIGKSREQIVSSPTAVSSGRRLEHFVSSPLASPAANRVEQIRLLRADGFETSTYIEQLRKSTLPDTTRLRLGSGEAAADTRQKLFNAETRNKELGSEIFELRKAAQTVLNDTVQITSLETTRQYEHDAEILALREKLTAVENSAAGYITGLEHQLEQRDILLEATEQRLELSEARVDDLERIVDLQDQHFAKNLALSEASHAMQGLELKTQLAHVEREARHLHDEAESRRKLCVDLDDPVQNTYLGNSVSCPFVSSPNSAEPML